MNTWLWFEVLPDMSPALPGAPRLVVGAPRLVVGGPRLVAGAPSYSEGRQECPPSVWYSLEIDTSKFTLHILSDTPGGLQWLEYILLMLCNATCPLGDGQRLILHHRVRHSVRAVRAVQNTRVFLTETRVVADVDCSAAVLGAYFIHIEITPHSLSTVLGWSVETNHSCLGGDHILATVAHMLEILALHLCMVAN